MFFRRISWARAREAWNQPKAFRPRWSTMEVMESAAHPELVRNARKHATTPLITVTARTTAELFTLTKADGCAVYPEADLNATGRPRAPSSPPASSRA